MTRPTTSYILVFIYASPIWLEKLTVKSANIHVEGKVGGGPDYQILTDSLSAETKKKVGIDDTDDAEMKTLPSRNTTWVF